MCPQCGSPAHYPSPYVASAMHPYVMAPTPMATPYASPYASPYTSPYPSPGSVTIQLPPTAPIPMMNPGTTLTVLPPPPVFMPSPPGAMICSPLPSGPGGFSPQTNAWNVAALQGQLDELNKELEKLQAEEELLTTLYSQVKSSTKAQIGTDLKDCLSKIADKKKKKQKLAPTLRMYGISDD